MTVPHNDSFVPLSPAGPSGRDRSDFKVTVIKQADNLRPFHSLGQAPASTTSKAACEPRVTLQREGDRVSGIQIQCSCGQVIDLACDYPVA